MVQFNILKFITSDIIHIDVQVLNLSYYENVYLDKIIIDSDQTVQESGPSENPVYTETLTGIQKSYSKDISVKEDLHQNEPHMYFVYVITKGTPSSDVPCGMDNQTSVKAVADLRTVYDKALSFIKCGKKCGCVDSDCVVSTKFANFALEFYRLTSSIEVGRNTDALDAYNKLMGKTPDGKKAYSSNCGCHENS